MFFTKINVFHFAYSLAFIREPKGSSMIVSTNNNNFKAIKAQKFSNHTMTSITYFGLKYKIYFKKVLVMTNDALT